MKLRIQDDLPFVETTVGFGGRRLVIENVLVDTGSARSVFSADSLAQIGVALEPNDPLHRISGVGGSEFVFGKTLEYLAVDEIRLDEMEVEVGAMDYGFPIQGILGNDFLLAAGVAIDMRNLEIRLAV